MTVEESRALTAAINSLRFNSDLHDIEVQSYETALANMRDRMQEGEKNDPLTLDDLKEMNGEPVWREQPGHDGRWVLVDCSWKSKGVIYLCNINGGSELAEIAFQEGVKVYRRRQKFVGGPGDGTIELITPPPGNKDMALEPCPFCGSTNVVYERYSCKTGERWRCWCADCIAGIDPGWAQQKIDVREMWNRRATEPNPPLSLEQIRDMDGEPVFIKHLKDGYGDWALVDLKYEVCRTAKGGLAIFETYGKTWTAYRRSLEAIE